MSCRKQTRTSFLINAVFFFNDESSFLELLPKRSDSALASAASRLADRRDAFQADRRFTSSMWSSREAWENKF